MRKLLFITVILAGITSCNPKTSWKKSAIETKEKNLMEQAKHGRVDTAGVNELLNAYESYADAYPADTAGANYLFKAADFYRYMKKPYKSIDIYRKIYANYPGFEKRPYALFLQGFMFENEVRVIDSAKAKYQQFLDTYPNHPIAKDVRITLNNIGKSPEQLIQEFEQRLKQDSTERAGK
jgi:tetratricopeptide (TPR) repeat protein